MKSKDKTNKKKHESTIGKIIYGFLLFMPLLAIGVTCLVNTFNNEAKNEHITIQYQSNAVNSLNDLIIGNAYELNWTVENTQSEFVYIGNIDSIEFFAVNGLPYLNSLVHKNIYIRTGAGNSQNFLFIGNDTSTIEVAFGYPISYENRNVKIPFVYKGGVINTTYVNQTNIDLLPYKQIIEKDLSNIFYYSIDKVQQSPLFNWAEDSAIYTGMTATCNTLNITTTFIPLLMTYWLIISIIYFLYDIILIILHVFHRKIHELEESI